MRAMKFAPFNFRFLSAAYRVSKSDTPSTYVLGLYIIIITLVQGSEPLWGAAIDWPHTQTHSSCQAVWNRKQQAFKTVFRRQYNIPKAESFLYSVLILGKTAQLICILRSNWSFN